MMAQGATNIRATRYVQDLQRFAVDSIGQKGIATHHVLPKECPCWRKFGKNCPWNEIDLAFGLHRAAHGFLLFIWPTWVCLNKAAQITDCQLRLGQLADRKDEVIKLRDAGNTKQEAAKKLGVSLSTLGHFYQKERIKWPRRGKLHGRKDEVIKLRDAGNTQQEAAKKLGVPYPTLCGFCKKEHIKWKI